VFPSRNNDSQRGGIKNNERERVRSLTREKLRERKKEEGETRFWRSNKGRKFSNRENEHSLNSLKQWRVLNFVSVPSSKHKVIWLVTCLSPSEPQPLLHVRFSAVK
jgi:hypothetical protein